MDMKPSFSSSSVTGKTIKKVVHLWTIENFEDRTETEREYIVSPEFPGPDNIKWQLRIFPNASNTDRHVAVYLSHQSVPEKKFDARFTFEILNKSHEKCHGFSSDLLTFNSESDTWGCGKFICRSTLLTHKDSLLPEGNLNIHCEMLVNCERSVLKDSESYSDPIKDYRTTVPSGFAELFDNKKFCDVSIFVKNKKFRAHKAVLAIRSPVFEEMFSERAPDNLDTTNHDMKLWYDKEAELQILQMPRNQLDSKLDKVYTDGISNIDLTNVQKDEYQLHDLRDTHVHKIRIDDADPQVVQEMLRFIYTGKVKNLSERSVNLLILSVKYSLTELKSLCISSLLEQLNISNAAEFLRLADNHSVEHLKQKVIQFIRANPAAVSRTPVWVDMILTKSTLLDEVKSTAQGFLT